MAVEREGEKVAKRLRVVGPEMEELLSSAEEDIKVLKEELSQCKRHQYTYGWFHTRPSVSESTGVVRVWVMIRNTRRCLPMPYA